MRILGIDPGLNTTGYAVLDFDSTTPKVVEAGILRSSKGRETPDMAVRLKSLYDGLKEVIGELKPETMAVEQLYAHYDHPRTAILMAHARGVIFLLGGQASIPVLSYTATQIKKIITGNGRASKEQMQYTMLRELNLKVMPEPHDVADALSIALCHGYHSRRTVETESA
jgi:crossover junction endodeoxyribonuclease RuvC